ncbi:hypothetical protein [Sphingomonas sp.]
MSNPAPFQVITIPVKGIRSLLAVTTYDADFVAAAKSIGARFVNIEGGRKGWYIAADSDQAEAFREICGDARRALKAKQAETASAKAKQADAAAAKANAAYIRMGETRGIGSVSPSEFAGLRQSIGDANAVWMARQMQG